MSKIWEVFAMLGITAILALVIGFFCTTKKVDGYYLSHAQETSMATCIYAHWTWHVDEISFCTNNYQEALDFVAKANATVR